MTNSNVNNVVIETMVLAELALHDLGYTDNAAVARLVLTQPPTVPGKPKFSRDPFKMAVHPAIESVRQTLTIPLCDKVVTVPPTPPQVTQTSVILLCRSCNSARWPMNDHDASFFARRCGKNSSKDTHLSICPKDQAFRKQWRQDSRKNRSAIHHPAILPRHLRPIS